MAIKDWKKEQRNGQITFIRKNRVRGESFKGSGVIAIQEIPNFEGKSTYVFRTSSSGTVGRYKSKTQALKHAKRYMKIN